MMSTTLKIARLCSSKAFPMAPAECVTVAPSDLKNQSFFVDRADPPKIHRFRALGSLQVFLQHSLSLSHVNYFTSIPFVSASASNIYIVCICMYMSETVVNYYISLITL